MFNSKFEIISQPLESPEFISILYAFRNLLLSAVGPRGGLKIIVTSGGCSTVTSSSTRILSYLPIQNPICLYISQVIKSQLAEYKDHGFFTGILTSSLLIHSLSQQIVPLRTVNSLVQHISSELNCQLMSTKITVEFSTVKQLLPLVKSILTSKPSVISQDTSSSVDMLAVTLVKAFLNSVDETIGDIIIISDTGLETSLHPGILYQTGLFTVTKEIMHLFERVDIKCRKYIVLFNIMLSHNKPPVITKTGRATLENSEQLFQVEKTLQVLKYAVSLGVVIVACQKVVHPLLCLYLRRNGVLLLDRMGTELTRYVEQLSGAVPISDVDKITSKECLVPLLGHVSVVQLVQAGRKSYVALERDDQNIATLLVGSINAEASEELKVRVDQALYALRHLLVQPYVLPGAGCSEMSLVTSLEARVMNKSAEMSLHFPTSHVQALLRWFQLSLLSAVGYNNLTLTTLYTDTSYYHAWNHIEGQDWSVCRCGLVTADMIRIEENTWINLDLNSSKLLSDCKMAKQLSISCVHENAVIDLYASKCNALKLSLESFVGLMGIGMVVYKPAQ